MLVAHLVAIPVGAVLIHAAEHAIRYAVSRLKRAVRGPAVGGITFVRVVAVPKPYHRPVRRLLLSSGLGTRGPPLVRV